MCRNTLKLSSLVVELSRHVRIDLAGGKWTPLCNARRTWKLKDDTHGETWEGALVALCGATEMCRICERHT